MQRLLRWSPASVALVVALLLAVNSFRADRRRADPTVVELDLPSAENVAICRRTDWRAEVVAELVAGRITGTEAHARFLDVNRSDSVALRNLRYAFPGDTDEERTVHQLVRFVRWSKHPRARAIEAALVAELLNRERLRGRRRTGLSGRP